MILSFGEICGSEKQDEILAGLEAKINGVRAAEPLDTGIVIGAFDRLAGHIEAGEFDALIDSLGLDDAARYKAQAVCMLRRESLEYRLRRELPGGMGGLEYEAPPFGLQGVRAFRLPLGTLFHIAAGNVDALPAMALAEGLLTGNVNILKLPQADEGLSITILKALVDGEPALAPYVHVFDTPSSDAAAMLKMAQMCDAVSVWGGDEAVQAVRRMAPPGVKLIEWGHRFSFCYVTGDHTRHTEELRALAEHVAVTQQLLCSSCQAVYIDTEDPAVVRDFCGLFLPMLQEAIRAHAPKEIGMAASLTLRRLTDEVEAAITGGSAQSDSTDLMGRLPVRALPRAKLMDALRKRKGRLQTAGLIADDPQDGIIDILTRAGVNRVTGAGEMSETFQGEAHDGEYPLQRYTRVVNSRFHAE